MIFVLRIKDDEETVVYLFSDIDLLSDWEIILRSNVNNRQFRY